MVIHVKLGEPLWRTTGQRRWTLAWPAGAAVTVGDALARLAAGYPVFEPALRGPEGPSPYRLFVDALPVAMESRLADGQTLYVLLPAIGG